MSYLHVFASSVAARGVCNETLDHYFYRCVISYLHRRRPLRFSLLGVAYPDEQLVRVPCPQGLVPRIVYSEVLQRVYDYHLRRTLPLQLPLQFFRINVAVQAYPAAHIVHPNPSECFLHALARSFLQRDITYAHPFLSHISGYPQTQRRLAAEAASPHYPAPPAFRIPDEFLPLAFKAKGIHIHPVQFDRRVFRLPLHHFLFAAKTIRLTRLKSPSHPSYISSICEALSTPFALHTFSTSSQPIFSKATHLRPRRLHSSL